MKSVVAILGLALATSMTSVYADEACRGSDAKYYNEALAYQLASHGIAFLSFHCYTKYVKVAFFRGASLRPVPPGESKHKEVRYLDIHEDDQLDEAQLAAG